MTRSGTLPFTERYGRVIYGDTPLPSSNPFNVKDWSNPECYPAPEELTLAQWRWEFLRRHNRYREFWGLTQQLISNGWETEPELDYHLGTFFLNKLVDPALEARDGELHFFAYRYHMARWLPAPNSGFDPEQALGLPSTEMSLEHFIEEVSYDEDILLVAIRVQRPLKPQFSAVSQLIETRRRARGVTSDSSSLEPSDIRLRPEKYRDYLRVLDARDEAGPYASKWKAIEKKLSEERAGMTVDRVRGLHKQAVETQSALAATPFVA